MPAKNPSVDPQGLHRSVFSMDNLHVLRAMNSESVDLIYLDPPFNSNEAYSAPIGSKAAGAAFKDAWTLSDVDLMEHNRLRFANPALYALIYAANAVHTRGMFSYLMMMAPRLVEMRRVLKRTGSLYLHCDPTASHYLKGLLDGVFGHIGFRNEIVWYYKNASRGKRQWAKSHDVILWYAKQKGQHVFNREELLVPFESGMTEWRYSRGGQKGRVAPKGKTPDDVIMLPSLNAMAKERTGYPTQKPLALLKLLINASSNEGDLVLDPFCGCATTMVAAELEDRRWAGIDLSPLAANLVVQRIKEERTLFKFKDIRHRKTVPVRTDIQRRLVSSPKAKRELKNRLFSEQDGLCNLCHNEFPHPRHFHMDHILPKAKGGKNWEDNFQLLCGSCNLIKGRGTQEEARARLVEIEGIDFAPFEHERIAAERRPTLDFDDARVAETIKARLAQEVKGGVLDPDALADALLESLPKVAENTNRYGRSKG